jgi:hypothetical protein
MTRPDDLTTAPNQVPAEFLPGDVGVEEKIAGYKDLAAAGVTEAPVADAKTGKLLHTEWSGPL